MANSAFTQNASPTGMLGVGNIDATLRAMIPYGLDTAKGLRIYNDTTNPNNQLRVYCDQIVLRDASDNPVLLTGWSNALVDLHASGAAGLDTGSESAAAWYYVWLIAKADGTKSQIFSASATAPTMPTDYIYKARVGAWRNESSNLLVARQSGKFVQYSGYFWNLVSAGGATSWTDRSSTYIKYVPAIAETGMVTLYANTAVCFGRYLSGGSSPTTDYNLYGDVGATDIKEHPNTQLWYYAVSATGTAYQAVIGFRL